ncbi:hypothetical protein NQ314_013865, partial [Rhamnusium bicolor]
LCIGLRQLMKYYEGELCSCEMCTAHQWVWVALELPLPGEPAPPNRPTREIIRGLLELGVRFILLNLKRAGNLTLTDDTTLIVPESLKSIIYWNNKRNTNLWRRKFWSYITRFWKNKSVSEFVTVIINILEKFVCMWMSYENECISCVLSPVVQYIVNDILPNNYENRLDIDCACLKGALGNKFGITYNVEEKLERLIYSYYQGNITNELTNKDVNNVKDIFEVVTNSIIEILNKEGVAFDV